MKKKHHRTKAERLAKIRDRKMVDKCQNPSCGADRDGGIFRGRGRGPMVARHLWARYCDPCLTRSTRAQRRRAYRAGTSF